MKHLYYLGILKEGFSPYSSPVMLISQKLTQDKRVVTDFRHLNVRIAKNNLAYPLVRDTFLVLGEFQMWSSFGIRCKVCILFVKTFAGSKKVLQYFAIIYLSKNAYGIKHIPLNLAFIYKCNSRLFRGQKTLWNNYGWLITFHSLKESTYGKVRRLIKGFIKEWAQNITKKCQLFKTELQYIENTIFIKDRKVCIKPLRNRIEAILKLKPRKMPKGCRSFVGMVNFLSMFHPELQKLLKPIYDLTRKGRPFIWEEEQQEAFKEIKRRLVQAPVLHMPNREGRFHLYSDTCKFAACNTLYQIQNDKSRLIAYASKRLLEVVRSYSVTELELCGLAISIASFLHLLKMVDVDAIDNHLALTHIIKSKAEPVTTRIKRLLELISLYSFNLYYMKGKDVLLSQFLSRQTHNTSDLHEIIPISFNMYNALYETYYRVDPTDRYLVQMWSKTKAAGVKLPEVHGTRKTIIASMPIEKQKPQIQEKQVNNNRPKLGRGRAGMQHKHPQPVADTLVSANKSP